MENKVEMVKGLNEGIEVAEKAIVREQEAFNKEIMEIMSWEVSDLMKTKAIEKKTKSFTHQLETLHLTIFNLRKELEELGE